VTPVSEGGRTCLIAGCGDVGTRAGLLLAAQGWRVVGLRRSGTLPSPIETFRADLTDPRSLGRVAHLAPDALVYLPTPDARTAGEYLRVYRDGLANLLDRLPQPPGRVLWVGSTAVHAESGAQWQDEDSAPEPEAWNGQVLVESERWIEQNVAGAVLLRLGGLYGPGREWMLRRARAGEPCRSRPPHWTNRIHVDDAAAAIAHLLGLREPAPLYLGVDEEPSTDCQVLRYLAGRLGLPDAALQDEPGAGPATGKRLSSRRLRETGFRFRYPSFREGYEALISAGPGA
jgi:nucleoside-diphosphate-sugar epimerase